MDRFFEDIKVGDTQELGTYTFGATEIIAFAEKFDPQPFHLSEEAAANTHFGRLCASGWHTASIFMKLMVTSNQKRREAALAAGQRLPNLGPSPGFEDLKWIKPVYAGDTLHYRRIVTGTTKSKSKPGWGIVHTEMLAHNQQEQLVFSFKGKVFVERKAAP